MESRAGLWAVMLARPTAPSPRLGGRSICGLGCGLAYRLSFSSGDGGEGTADGGVDLLEILLRACSEARQGTGVREGKGRLDKGGVSPLTSQNLRHASEVVSEALKVGRGLVARDPECLPYKDKYDVTELTGSQDWLTVFL